MGTFLRGLKTVATLAPKIAASPSHAPSIVRRHLSAQAAAALTAIFDTSDGSSVPPPQSAPVFGGVPYSYSGNGTPHPPTPFTAAYTTMAPGPAGVAPPPRMNPQSGAPASYGTMTAKTPYITMRTAVPQPPGAGSVPTQAGSQPGGPAGITLPDLANVPLLQMPVQHLYTDQAKNVKYVTDISTRFQKYAVTMHRTVLRRGMPLDTKDVKEHFTNKGVGIGLAIFGHDMADHNARFQPLAIEWGYQALIWVCVKEAGSGEPVFYSHMGKADRFHHSSFTAGGDVIAAGEWIIQKGKLCKISANSGHYRPPLDYFHRAVLFMCRAWHPDTVVLLWNIKKDTYEEVPVQVFAHNRCGGMYKTSPKA